MSEELKPCPFCGGEARIDNEGTDFYAIFCDKCGTLTSFAKDSNFDGSDFYTKEQVISAWNRRAQQPNEPLTVEELKSMQSEPVWVKSLLDGTVKGAVINNTHAAAYVLWCGVRYDTFDNYGKSWLAYRRPPEAGEKG